MPAINRITFTILLFITCTLSANAKHLHKEYEYQQAFCSANNGIMEYVLPDNTRVDCLTPDYAIEFDFANKWAESIGQALYYGLMTNRNPVVVLIMEQPTREQKYLNRLNKVAEKHGIKVFVMTSLSDNKIIP